MAYKGFAFQYRVFHYFGNQIFDGFNAGFARFVQVDINSFSMIECQLDYKIHVFFDAAINAGWIESANKIDIHFGCFFHQLG
ncbi:hypothetical protein D3C85_1063590 [compost metagenome]